MIPNIPFFSSLVIPPPAPPAAPGVKRLIAVATWGYPPNALGLDRFAARVWPAVRAAHPDATLAIVGSGLREPLKSRLASAPGIHLAGFVNDLRAHYAAATLAVAPVYQGGGTKIKVLEALAHARAVIVTPHAHHGYEHVLSHDDALLVADSDAAFARHIDALLAAPSERARLAVRGYTLVNQHFSYDAVRQGVHAVVHAVALSASRP